MPAFRRALQNRLLQIHDGPDDSGVRPSIQHLFPGGHFIDNCAKCKNIRARVDLVYFALHLLPRMYCDVPRIVPSAVGLWLSIGSCDIGMLAGAASCLSSAKPKSSSFTPFLVDIKFPGLMLLWITSLRRALSRASEISMAYCSTYSGTRGPLSRRVASVSPSTYSITRKSIPYLWPTSYSAQVCGSRPSYLGLKG